ncbi:hypothetical protein SDC9_133714 [bioreactor metagenome]|uniref:Uncharacterized protein n=1 Tax=bioreactor metagenome TaxID=1076179 RepID=A0A645DBA3_9ZZZZ
MFQIETEDPVLRHTVRYQNIHELLHEGGLAASADPGYHFYEIRIVPESGQLSQIPFSRDESFIHVLLKENLDI